MKIIAHRGFSSRAPENTLAAFKMALEFGVDGLELDVHLSKDSELIICHDEKVDRTTNGRGFIKDYSWQELQKFDAGSWFNPRFAGEKTPRLQELLALVKGTQVLVNIELKTNIFPYPGIEEKVVQMVKHFGLVEQCIISSFNHYSLVRMASIFPKLKTGALYETVLYEPWNYVQTFGAAALHPQHYSVYPELVVEAKRQGLMVNTWTLDEPLDIVKAMIAKVDGIISNRPDVVKGILNQDSRI